MPTVDARISRLEQGIVTVLLLAGFVFRLPWMIPLAGVITGADAALRARGPVPLLWGAVAARRVGAASSLEHPGAVRLQALLVTGLLAVATLLLVAGLGGVAWLVAVPTAGLSALAATGLVCVGCELHRNRHGRPAR